jgi:DTW domain-containing protein
MGPAPPDPSQVLTTSCSHPGVTVWLPGVSSLPLPAPLVDAPSSQRVVCQRCRRPPRCCYCAHLSALPTRTNVLLLQHPRERRVGVGTARMAHLALPSSVLRVGVDFTGDRQVQATLAGEGVHLLFPGPGARDVGALAPAATPLTLVVLDGTWWHARKLLKLNPALAALPRLCFTPREGSSYRIRRQPAPFCVSTIEALAHVLAILEPDAGPFDRLLDPFHAMVRLQERFAAEVQCHRHRRDGTPRPARPRQATWGDTPAAALPRR